MVSKKIKVIRFLSIIILIPIACFLWYPDLFLSSFPFVKNQWIIFHNTHPLTERTYEYYEGILIDTGQNIIGRFPASEKTIKQGGCYRFAYDSKGRLVQIAHMYKGELKFDMDMAGDIIVIHYSENKETRFWTKRFTQNDYIKLFESQEEEETVVSKVTLFLFKYFVFMGRMPVVNNDNVEVVLLEKNRDGHVFSIKNFAFWGLAADDDSGVHQYRMHFDTQGHPLHERMFDEDGKRIADKQGVYEFLYQHDSIGNILEKRCLGQDGEAVNKKGKGYSIIRRKYDHDRNMIEYAYFDKSDKPVEIGKNGIAMVKSNFDDQGFRTEARMFGASGQLKEGTISGVAIVKKIAEENEDSLKIQSWYYGTDGKLKNRKDAGYATCYQQYNDRWDLAVEAYFDAEMNLVVPTRMDYALLRYEYDENGDLVKTIYYDQSEQIVKEE